MCDASGCLDSCRHATKTHCTCCFPRFRLKKPCVIDMTNFEGMGTLLYSTFIELASGRPLLRWAVSAAARHHLQAMKLPEETIFQSVETAIESLK